MASGWALVSPGRHADTCLAPAIGLAEETHLVAVYSREHQHAEAFAAKHGAQVAYTSLEALLADARVDVVCIASPNFLHAPYTTLAARVLSQNCLFEAKSENRDFGKSMTCESKPSCFR